MNSSELFVQSRNAMGAVFTIYLYAQDQEQAEPSLDAAFEEVERLELNIRVKNRLRDLMTNPPLWPRKTGR